MITFDKLFINGHIYTMDNRNTVAEALAIEGDKIVSVGSNQDILQLRGRDTEVIDLEGHAVIPGLIDSHTHVFWTGVSELYGELFMPTCIAEIIEYVKDKTTNIPKGEWIHLKNVYPTRLREHRYPTVEELDLVSPNHPVLVDGAYAGRANSHAMRIAGIDESTPSLEGLSTIRSHIREREYDIHDHKNGIQNIQRKYNKFGITSVIDGISSDIGVRAASELYSEDKLNIRMSFTKVVGSEETALEEMREFEDIIEMPPEWGKLSFMKIILDGGILTGTSYMRRPYRDKIGVFGMEDGFRGVINYDAHSIKKFIDVAYNEDYQMTAHCIGDGALDILLQAYEEYQIAEDIRDRRFSIIHGDFTDDEALNTIRELGLVLLFQPAWHFKDATILKRVLDEETFDDFLPYSKYIEKGIYGAAGSDHMVKYDPLLSQNPYHPFWALYNMITGNTLDGKEMHKRYSISRGEALRFYTMGGAYATFDEKIKGSLEPGKLADFAVLSEDYFTCPCENITSIRSIFTVIGGKCIYSS